MWSRKFVRRAQRCAACRTRLCSRLHCVPELWTACRQRHVRTVRRPVQPNGSSARFVPNRSAGPARSGPVSMPHIGVRPPHCRRLLTGNSATEVERSRGPLVWPPTHYELLGVALTASSDEIRRAFRREIAKYHPDKVQHLGNEFQDHCCNPLGGADAGLQDADRRDSACRLRCPRRALRLFHNLGRRRPRRFRNRAHRSTRSR